MSKRDVNSEEPRHVRLLAKLADFLEYACWDYADDSEQAKDIVKQADDWLHDYRHSYEQ